MKLVTLNTWGGRVHDPLLEFFQKNKDIDIFCLQEIYHNAPSLKIEKEYLKDAFKLYSEIENILDGHHGYFRPHIEDWYGLAIFIKKEIKVKEEGDIFVYENEPYVGGGNHSRNIQYIVFDYQGEDITVINFHGLWNGKGKTDTEERLLQSENIMKFVKSIKHRKILCGDFNLKPDTKSLSILEKELRNLIKDYKITSTRSSLYTKNEKYADYVLTSPNLKLINFKIMEDVVSDHLPLLLEF